MQFKPIIHNLSPEQEGYKECQLYNSLISNRPKGGNSLATKLGMLKGWENLCIQAREAACKKLGVKHND